MVLLSERAAIEADLLALKASLGLEGEIKWTQVRPFNWERVATVLERFLDFVEDRHVKLRFMWLDQLFAGTDALTEFHDEYGYYILYYFFVVLGFGLPWHDQGDEVRIEFLPDRLPDDAVKRAEFRAFLLRCHNAARYRNKSPFRFVSVGDVNSKHHVLLQCVDVIIGAVGFRLNGMYLKKSSNGRKSESTKVKLELYKRLHKRIGRIDMGDRGGLSFAFGVSTGKGGEWENIWRNKFRQWSFHKPGTVNPNWMRG